MWIRLLKSYTMNTGKKLPVGKVFNVMRREGEKLVSEGTAERYDGPFPPKKLKTEFFKPKIVSHTTHPHSHEDGNNRSSFG